VERREGLSIKADRRGRNSRIIEDGIKKREEESKESKRKAKDKDQWIEESREESRGDESRGDEPHSEALEGVRDHITLNRRDVQVGVLAFGEIVTGLDLRRVQKMSTTVKGR
jgi:hypothetical protein